jgi:murein DD-endopeptidase MepM/ murein hydrolase activator NlpD
MRIPAAALLCVVISWSCAALGWHELVSLRGRPAGSPPTRFVTFMPGGPAIANADNDDGADNLVTLLDWDFGRLNDGDLVAFRLRDGTFLSSPSPDSKILAGSGEVRKAETFRIRIASRSGQCETGVPGSNQIPSPLSSEIGKTCLIRIESIDDVRVLFAAPDGTLQMRVMQLPYRAANDELFVISLKGLPSPMGLSAPFHPGGRVMLPVHVDHSPGDLRDGPGCRNPRGGPPVPCYRGHMGTDFPADPRYVDWGVYVAPIEVVAAAPGRVVGVVDGQFDRCYLNPLANCVVRPGSPLRCPDPFDPAQLVHCNGGPAERANKVVLVQDDGLIVNYVHLKKGSVRVAKGDRVMCGQVLGHFGSSGISSVPHLHFDMATPPLCVDENPNGLQCNPLSFAHDDETWSRNGARHGSPRLVDPYVPRFGGRSMLWTAFESNGLPRLTCKHPSQDAFRPSTGRGGLGEPCAQSVDCNPGTVCLSSATCGYLGELGDSCGVPSDCGRALTCAKGVCAPVFTPPVVPPPDIAPPAECPPGLAKKCVAPCFDDDGRCSIWRYTLGGRHKLSCERICAP